METTLKARKRQMGSYGPLRLKIGNLKQDVQKGMINMMIIVSVQKLIDRGVLEAYCQEKGYDSA
ncbi:MAG: hypothetical protein ACFFGZ_13080 [Candidatus Thorarchaeota archaeon]